MLDLLADQCFDRMQDIALGLPGRAEATVAEPQVDADPAPAQDEVLHRLLQVYAETDYGSRHGAANIDTINDYRFTRGIQMI